MNTSEIVKLLVERMADEENYQDSLEIGTPAKGGAVKVYLDYRNPAEAEAKILNAFALRDKAAEMQRKFLEVQ